MLQSLLFRNNSCAPCIFITGPLRTWCAIDDSYMVDNERHMIISIMHFADELVQSDPADGLPFLIDRKNKTSHCAEFVTNLQQVYRTAQPPTWDPLPQCQHVKLAMIKEKGKRCGSDKTIAESRVEGDVDKLLTIKVPVDSDKIFDVGTFDNDRQVILVEGVGGMGKTSLAYQYAQKWAEGKLSTFDAVALVRLRDLNEHDVCEVDHILPHLLFLATGNSISKEMARFS